MAKCEYCGNYILDTESTCPNCGAVNENMKRVANGVPTTIEQLKEIREKAPHTYFLIPGYGAQGGKAEDIALGFDENALGGIVNASRSLMCAYKSDKWKEKYSEAEYGKATRAEALDMRDVLNSVIK